MIGPVGGVFARTAIQDTLVGDVPVKRGTFINFHASPMLFNTEDFPDPHSFKPERWEA